MARPAAKLRLKSYSLMLSIIIATLQFHELFAQQCDLSCSQTAVIRNMPYEELVEIAQNRMWEDEEDFCGDLCDIARRRKYSQKRVKRSPAIPLNVDLNVNQYDNKETMAMFAFSVAAAAFGNYLVQEEPLSVAAPPVCPKGGCGGLPRGRGKFIKEARSLFNDLIKSAGLPKGLNPVSVFPPYADEKVISDESGFRTTALIFEDKKCPDQENKKIPFLPIIGRKRRDVMIPRNETRKILKRMSRNRRGIRSTIYFWRDKIYYGTMSRFQRIFR